jgi:hypothetical protein
MNTAVVDSAEMCHKAASASGAAYSGTHNCHTGQRLPHPRGHVAVSMRNGSPG